MESTPVGNWFYARGSERFGPVPQTEIELLVRSGQLDPARDLAWQSGMASWKPIAEIPELATSSVTVHPSTTEPVRQSAEPIRASMEPARQSSEPVKAAEPIKTASPAKSPAAHLPIYNPSTGSAASNVSMGSSRRYYILFALVLPILLAIAPVAAGIVAPLLDPRLMNIVALVGTLVSFVLSLIFTLRRFTNLGMSKLWLLGCVVPLLNVWLAYRCFACPQGYAVSRKLDKPGIVLAIIFWLMILLSVALVGVMVYGAMTFAQNPETRNYLQELIQLMILRNSNP